MASPEGEDFSMNSSRGLEIFAPENAEIEKPLTASSHLITYGHRDRRSIDRATCYTYQHLDVSAGGSL